MADELPDPDLFRPYPFNNCPPLERGLLNSEDLFEALEGAMRSKLDAIAAGRGLRPGKCTSANLNRLCPGLPDGLLRDVLSDEQVKGAFPTTIRKARKAKARKCKEDLFRSIGACTRAWRRRRIYVDEAGKPACLVSFMAEPANIDTLVDDYLFNDHNKVAEYWGLEIYIPAPSLFWFHSRLAIAIEIHKPGLSVLRPRNDEERDQMVQAWDPNPEYFAESIKFDDNDDPGGDEVGGDEAHDTHGWEETPGAVGD